MQPSHKAAESGQDAGRPSSTSLQAQALLRGVPRRVHATAVLATALGVFLLLRFCAAALADKLTFGKAILYGLLVFGLLFMNGFSLIRKSRAGYLIVVVVALLPVAGLLAQSLHLIVLLISGNLTADNLGVLDCGLSAAQLVITAFLFLHLLSREVRVHVWKQAQ